MSPDRRRHRAASDSGHLDIEVAHVRERLGSLASDGSDPPPARGWQAATAIVVAPGDDGPVIAFIRRSERAGDRWSGQMALPGGRRDPDDADLAVTAVREAREEVGLELTDHVGRLPDQTGHTSRGLVATFVHVLGDRPGLHPDPREVAEALWIPLSRLLDPGAAARVRWIGVPVPAIDYDGRVIWGLTHRILGTFVDAIGLTLPR